MLGLSTLGQSASSAAVNGPAFLIPALHHGGLSLATAGLIAAAAIAGSTCTLVLWGAVVDASGERFVLVSSLASSALALAAAAWFHESTVLLGVFLFLAGAASAGTSSASGRVVVGWFPPRRRGTAMGIRQMAQPIGVGLAAIAIPVMADLHGIGAALAVPAAFAAVTALACWAWVLDPARPPRPADVAAENPYRNSTYLTRIHAVSILLVIPQFTVWTFMLVWLQVGRDWSPGAAGALVAAAQVLGAVGRIGAGHLSDVVGSRTRPLRWVAVAAGLTMLAVGVTIRLDWSVAVPLIMLATMITVADNGLAFTAVAERAGPFWSGRALGLQNTGQYLTATAVPPLIGLLIPLWGYGVAFGLTGLFPLLAAPLVPRDEADLDT
ncbi:MFS transporter [Nocardioides marmoriginsengisoli]|uniref:MFS transporter n=2 Tax=Nocardioides marmoriginsengisoli TaxID=661483 RepID=A0A3N0CAJ4_9ACTN|nr:MFS transporter [Nocardioides marmoriginsengisoli]